jgi:hypothetical protein
MKLMRLTQNNIHGFSTKLNAVKHRKNEDDLEDIEFLVQKLNKKEDVEESQ